MWPFRQKQIVDEDARSWIVENFAWLIEKFGTEGAFAKTELVLPKEGYFKADGEKEHALALRIFDQVKTYCKMPDWAVTLVADENPAAALGKPAAIMIAPVKHSLGTFEHSPDEGAVISYSTSLLRQPERLIATFVHELSHYLLSTEPTRACDEDEEEFLTDLCAIFLGFGVFTANSLFESEQLHDGNLQGWRMSRSGYLPERDVIFALALFIAVREIDPQPALGSLKPHLAALLKKSLRGFQRNPNDVAELRALAKQVENRPRVVAASPGFYAWRASVSRMERFLTALPGRNTLLPGLSASASFQNRSQPPLIVRI